MNDRKHSITHVNVEPLAVEVARLDVHEGDVVFITPLKEITYEHRQALEDALAALTRRTKIHFVVKTKDFDVTVLRKVQP